MNVLLLSDKFPFTPAYPVYIYIFIYLYTSCTYFLIRLSVVVLWCYCYLYCPYSSSLSLPFPVVPTTFSHSTDVSYATNGINVLLYSEVRP